jgi:hypothetical protein
MSYSNMHHSVERPTRLSGTSVPADMLASPAQPMFSSGKAGVGLFFQEEKKELIVRNIVAGGSAEANGSIKPGDIIISVDGKSVEGQGIETLRDCIIGSIGTFVELSFLRPSRSSTETSITQAKTPNIFSVVLERKSQNKTVVNQNSSPTVPPLAPQSEGMPSAVPSADDNLEIQKLHRRVSNLTFEKADLQSLLDQKNAQAEARQKTIEMLETQLQSSIAENDRLAREAEFAKTRESQSQAGISSRESSIANELAAVKTHRDSLEVELQQLKQSHAEQTDALERSQRLAADKHTENKSTGEALAAAQLALSAAESELRSARSVSQEGAENREGLRLAAEANARLSEDNKALRGASCQRNVADDAF